MYILATFGDWIQGGYLYALYAEYGYSMGGIAALFVVGYGAAATVGTYVGAVGDVHGHRTNCMACAARLRFFSCVQFCEPQFISSSTVIGVTAWRALCTSSLRRSRRANSLSASR